MVRLPNTGDAGATACAPYEPSTSTNDTCQRSGDGKRFNNECVCGGFAAACEKPVASVPPGSCLHAEPLPAGEWANYFVPLDSAGGRRLLPRRDEGREKSVV